MPSPRTFGHGGDDARPHGRSADRQQADARRGGAHPALRRRFALHVKSLPASITRRRDARSCRRSCRRRRGPAARWWSWAAGGLEAARVAAERGHKVVLFEAANQLGGQLLLAVRATWRRDLIAIVDWRTAELARLGVEVRLNTYATADDVQREKPDAVIVATGGVPDTAWLDGAEHCTTVWDILSGTASAKDEVIVYDGTGRHQAVSCAPRRAGPRRAVRHPRRQHGPGDGIQRPRRLPEALRRARCAYHHRPSARARATVGQRPGRDLPPRAHRRDPGAPCRRS